MPIAAAASNALKITGKKNRGGQNKSHIISKPFPPGGAILVAKVVPESCQRTDGIKAWLELKEEKETKRLEKEEKRKEKEEVFHKITEGRIARNAERQRDIELRKLEKLMKRNSILDQEVIEETQFNLRELDQIIDNKGAVNVACQDCQACQGNNAACQCDCTNCDEARTLRAAQSGKLTPGRGPVRCVKRHRGRRGRPDRIELLVNIDLSVYKLSKDQVSDCKELFILFDKDENGVLTFAELGTAMRTLGQRLPEAELLSMVRAVSEDKLYDTIEFNEFLKMMSNQQNQDIQEDALVEAFKYFDKDKDGFLTVPELRKIMTSMGDRMSKREFEAMVQEADRDNDGLINCKEFCSILCPDDGAAIQVENKKKSAESKRRVTEEAKYDYSSSRNGSFSQG